MSAAIFRCPGIWTAFSERSFPWEHTRIWCASLYKGRERRPPGGWYKSPSLCCQCAPTHGDLSDLVERVWVLETLPASPGSWCATWDGDHSTDRGQGGHSWPLHKRWEMHPSLTLCGDKELPATGPETRNKVSSTCLRHVGIAAWPWSCEVGFLSGITPWSSATTVGVSCTASQNGRSWHQTQQFLKLLNSEWPAFSYSLDWREDWLDPSRGYTCLHHGWIPHHAQISGSLYWRNTLFWC